MNAPGSSTRRHVNLAGLVMSVAGVALLGWQLRHASAREQIVAGLRQIGAGFLVVLALGLARFVARAYAWRSLLEHDGHDVPLRRLVAAGLAGDALGNVTFLSMIIGEPTKALYLRPRVATPRAFASLAAENFFYSVTVAIMLVIGTAAFLIAFTTSGPLRVFSIAILASMVASLAGALWLVWREPAVISSIVRRLPFRRAAALVGAVHDFEEKAYGFARAGRGRLALVWLSEGLFHAASLAEAWVALVLLTGSATLLETLVFDTVQRAITVVFKMIPLRLGVDQAGTALVASALGIGAPIAYAIAFVRQGRILVWSLVGLALLGLKRRES